MIIIETLYLISISSAPPYHTKHRVQASGWSYASSSTGGEVERVGDEKIVDLSVAPPYQKPPPGYKVSYLKIRKLDRSCLKKKRE